MASGRDIVIAEAPYSPGPKYPSYGRRGRCDKKCVNGHLCHGVTGEEECPPCKALVKFDFVKHCGHVYFLPCYVSHLPIYREECHKLFPSPMRSTCGHEVSIPCFATDGIKKQDIVKYCTQCEDSEYYRPPLAAEREPTPTQDPPESETSQ